MAVVEVEIVGVMMGLKMVVVMGRFDGVVEMG